METVKNAFRLILYGEEEPSVLLFTEEGTPEPYLERMGAAFSEKAVRRGYTPRGLYNLLSLLTTDILPRSYGGGPMTILPEDIKRY